MNETFTPPMGNPEADVQEKVMVNCPKCSTTLQVKTGNYAHLCPVCSQVFRIRLKERMTRDVNE